MLVVLYGQHSKADCISGNLTACRVLVPGQEQKPYAETYTLNPGDFSKKSWSYSGGSRAGGGTQTADFITIEWTEPGWHSLTVAELDPNNPREPCTITIFVKEVAGGTLSNGTEICQGSSTTLTLTGYAGLIQQWEKTTDGSTWEVISHTGATYNTGALSAATSYRVLVSECAESAYSNTSDITISVPTPGNASGDTNFCTGELANGTASIANYGGFIMTWEMSEYSNGTWGEWVGTGSLHGIESYNYSVSVQTRFRAKISAGVCGTIYSEDVEVMETAPAEAGYISGPSEVCSGAPFSLSLVGASGVAEWYMKDAQHDYGPIGSPNGITITRPYWFKAVVRDAGCTLPDEAEFYVAVKPTLFVSVGPVYQEICPGAAVNLMTLESSGLPVKWERKDEGSSSWSTVATGVAPGSFKFSPVNVSGLWRAAVTNGCGDIPSNPVEVKVLDAIPTPQITNVSVCPGETAVLSVGNPQPSPTRYVWYSFSNGQHTVLTTTALNEYRIPDPTNATYSVAFERVGCIGPKSSVQVALHNSALVPAAPYINVTTTPVYNVKIYKNNTSAGGVSYYWQTQSNVIDVTNQADVIDMPASGLYYVRARNSSGCWSGVSEPVEVVNHVPSQTQYAAAQINYARTYTFLEPSTVNTYPTNLDTESDPSKISINSTYIDGLGRPVQSVQKKASPTGNDQVTVLEYDEAGRKVRDYLPYISTDGSGDLKTTPFPEQRSFYGTGGEVAASYFPFSYQQTERSPLDRAQASYAPGNDWAGLAGSAESKKVAHHYLSNTLADGVWLWQVDAQGMPFTNSNYTEGFLFLNETLDEHGFRVREFKTKEDKLVLKRVQVAADTWADTYYIYDDFGNLVAVLPPEAVKKMKAIINGN